MDLWQNQSYISLGKGSEAKKKKKYSYASLERIPRDWAKLCLIAKLPYFQFENNYKISSETTSCMLYRRACLISGCALAKLHCDRKYHLYLIDEINQVNTLFGEVG